MLPADLQRRQAAVASAADHQLQQALAAERRQFEEERRRLDRQLAEQQALLAEREAELQRVEEERRRQQQLEEEERRRQQRRIEQERQREEDRRQQQLREQQQEREGAQLWRQQQQQPLRSDGLQLAEPRQLPRQLDLPVLQLSPAASGAGYNGQPQQRRSVSAALAAVAGSPSLADYSGGLSLAAAAAPAASYATSRHASPPVSAPLPPPRANGFAPRPGLGSSLRAAATSLGAGSTQLPRSAVPRPAAAGGAAAGSEEDPLARARRQVLAAKSYLRQISAQADMQDRPPPGGAA